MNSKRLFKIATPIFAVLAILAIVFIVRCSAGSASPSVAYRDGTYMGIGNGRNGPIKVNVTISNGKIAKIDIVEDEETPGMADPAFMQIPDAIIKAQSVDVDVAAGATITSEGIKEAVAAALAKAMPVSYRDGTYTGQAEGKNGPVKVNVTIVNGKITNIDVVEHDESMEIAGNALTQIPDAIIKSQSTNIDVAAGATITSNAIKDAVAAALAKAISVPYKDGTYTSSANGKNGPIKVNVTIVDGKITKIEVVEHDEAMEVAGDALTQIPDAIIKAQSTDVDVAAGATITSNAIKDAVAAALLQANVASLADTASSNATVTGNGSAYVANGRSGASGKSFGNGKSDIVIIGAGGAGLAAATEAASLGAKVIVLEKMGITGGNTLSATGGLNAAETRYQKEQGIEDSKKQFYDDTMKGGGNKNNSTLVRNLTDKAPETVDWLISLGADLTDVGKMAGSTNSRTHRPKGGAAVGPHLVKVLTEAAEKAGAEIRLNNKVIDLVGDKNNTKPVGVVVENPDGTTYTIDADAIIIATGGFGANPDMITKHNPSLEGFGTTNHRGATGDAFAWIEKFHMALEGIEQIQTHPTVIPTSGVMITEAVRGNGAIMVNRNGERFGNEMATRDVMSADILKQSGQTAYLLFDQGVRESLKAIEGYVQQGLLTQGNTVAELAKNIGVDANALQATVNKYNAMQQAGNGDTEFGRKASEMVRAIATGPYYAVEVGPAIHHTMGGIKINKFAEVIATNDSIIPGLFACGEVTGGIHGENRLGGNAVADICVYGKIAGDSAIEYVNKLKK